ncbi:hypothetical protein HAX54_049416 [Datura stramonium]|uniref:Uncharacterized protein n=1 Tax=Datura stramonium TaxID=4076 RepID=A0ABS8WKF6_DATST|nr:hypothetical protein [Datura stramonium]
MKAYYLSFKEKREITEVGKLNVDSFKGAKGVIDLATKKDKDTLVFKKKKLTTGPSDPSPTETSEMSLFHLWKINMPLHRQVAIKMAQMPYAYNAQILKIAKAIPPTIQYAIKISMNPVVEKSRSLCARVDVLEEEVTSMREEMDR